MTPNKVNDDAGLEPLLVRQSRYVCETAQITGKRSGQILFNTLRAPVADQVRGTRWDPFGKNLTFEEVMQWYQDHVEFNDHGIMISVRGGNELLWKDTNG